MGDTVEVGGWPTRVRRAAIEVREREEHVCQVEARMILSDSGWMSGDHGAEVAATIGELKELLEVSGVHVGSSEVDDEGVLQ